MDNCDWVLDEGFYEGQTWRCEKRGCEFHVSLDMAILMVNQACRDGRLVVDTKHNAVGYRFDINR